MIDIVSFPMHCFGSCAGFVSQKKEEQDATFCLIKDGTFLSLFCLTNPALVFARLHANSDRLHDVMVPALEAPNTSSKAESVGYLPLCNGHFQVHETEPTRPYPNRA
jgi:hypothetical protein